MRGRAILSQRLASVRRNADRAVLRESWTRESREAHGAVAISCDFGRVRARPPALGAFPLLGRR